MTNLSLRNYRKTKVWEIMAEINHSGVKKTDFFRSS